MNGTCGAVKRNGGPCTLPTTGPNGLCWAHDPTNAEKRRRGQSRGGKNKYKRETAAIRDRLHGLVEEVRAGRVDRADAAVINQIYNTLLRTVSVELNALEVLDLEARIEALETLLESKNEGGRGWGA